EALGDHLTLPGEALVLLPSGFHILLHLLQAGYRLWGAAWTTLCRLAIGVVGTLMHPLERLFRLRSSLGSSPLFGGQWSRDGLAQFVLHMEDIRRVMRPQVMFNVRQQSRGLIAGRLDDLTVGMRSQGYSGSKLRHSEECNDRV